MSAFLNEFEQNFAELPLSFHSFAKRLRQVDLDKAKHADSQSQDLLLRTALVAVRAAEREIAEQKKRIHQLENLSITDETTGLLNRRGFSREVSRALSAAKRRGKKGVLVICDLDGFKNINDTLGHAAGDAVLAQIADLLNENVRSTDSLARLGGDEFAILMTDTSAEMAAERARQLSDIINRSHVPFNGKSIPVRASFGIVEIDVQSTAAELYQAADEAMYRQKRDRSKIPA